MADAAPARPPSFLESLDFLLCCTNESTTQDKSQAPLDEPPPTCGVDLDDDDASDDAAEAPSRDPGACGDDPGACGDDGGHGTQSSEDEGDADDCDGDGVAARRSRAWGAPPAEPNDAGAERVAREGSVMMRATGKSRRWLPFGVTGRRPGTATNVRESLGGIRHRRAC